MSQNKTIIPDSEFDPTFGDPYAGGGNQSLYAPSGYAEASGGAPMRTMMPGEVPDTPATTPAPALPEIRPEERAFHLQQRVLIGVLFSISRGILGEIFPLYLGRNILGSAANCDIVLSENSVSAEHAILYIRSDAYPDSYPMTLTDYGSTHGTMLNSNDCRYETLEVKEGDVISIGKHYKLLLKLFDVKQAGLEEDANFNYEAQDAPKEIHTPNLGNDFYAPTDQGDSSRTVIS